MKFSRHTWEEAERESVMSVMSYVNNNNVRGRKIMYFWKSASDWCDRSPSCHNLPEEEDEEGKKEMRWQHRNLVAKSMNCDWLVQY